MGTNKWSFQSHSKKQISFKKSKNIRAILFQMIKTNKQNLINLYINKWSRYKKLMISQTNTEIISCKSDKIHTSYKNFREKNNTQFKLRIKLVIEREKRSLSFHKTNKNVASCKDIKNKLAFRISNENNKQRDLTKLRISCWTGKNLITISITDRKIRSC